MRIIKSIVLSALILTGTSCTEPGETTEVAAATGGVLGAGLGAIIGSQTGDPGAGLVIGAAAGAGTGAMIGNSIQAQEEALRNQDEAIERQERVIAAQRSELEELRKMNQDNPNFRTRLNNSISNSAYQQNPGRAYPSYPSRDSRASYNPRPQIQERTLPIEQPAVPVAQPMESKPKGYSAALYDQAPLLKPETQPEVKPEIIAEIKEEPKREEIVAKLPVAEPKADRVIPEADEIPKTVEKNTVSAVTESSGDNTTECGQAEQEMNKANLASDASDKLFHTRRAIRLCSERPSYHNSLGQVYISLNRKDDAVFEFQEALKYDPTYQPAKDSLAKLSGGSKFPNADKY